MGEAPEPCIWGMKGEGILHTLPASNHRRKALAASTDAQNFQVVPQMNSRRGSGTFRARTCGEGAIWLCLCGGLLRVGDGKKKLSQRARKEHNRCPGQTTQRAPSLRAMKVCMCRFAVLARNQPLKRVHIYIYSLRVSYVHIMYFDHRQPLLLPLTSPGSTSHPLPTPSPL